MSRKIDIAKSLLSHGLIFAGLVVAAIVQIEAQSQTQVSNKMPAIDVVGVGDLHRMSAKKNTSGQFLPPWTSVEVTTVFGFNIQPRAGSRATFVPIGADLDQFDLNLIGSRIQDGCQDSSQKWWSAEFQPITDPRLFNIRAISGRSEEYPFDVVVIYPAVTSARQLLRSELKTAILPKGVKLPTVKAAIDVTSDGLPDLIITEYCCDNAAKTTECDNTCGATYKRSGTTWVKIDTSTPC